MRAVLLSIVLVLFLASVSYGAKLDTSFTFSTVETQHFSIHYHQGLEAVARKAAVLAEEAHDKLVDEFRWQPSEKTQLVLIDDSDFTNGQAITIPYNTIFVQVVPPSLSSTLGEYDDWLKELITHEYAHILTSDPARGYWKVARSIFGKPLPWLGDPVTETMFLLTAPPNTFMPRWWHEGMATWSESQFTGQGRGKGTFYDMVFRSAVADNNLPRVDQINGDVPYWPDGDLPYMFGYRFQRYLADTYGKEALGNLSIAHSGRFPYLINEPAQRLSGGKSYERLYRDMLAAVRKEQSEKIAILSRAPFTPLATISKQGENLTNPRFSPDGSRIAYTRTDPNDHRMVVITDKTGKKVVATFRRRYSDGNISWSPDGQRIYFTQSEINSGFDVYQDLYAYDLRGDSVTRLTHKQRLSEVDVSPDGKSIAAVVSSRGSQNLAIAAIGGSVKEPRPKLVTAYSLERVSSPHWSPDGTSICYAVRDNAGHTSVRIYDVATGKDLPLFTADYSVEYPIWSRGGSYLLYISDETGVFNLFAYDLRQKKSYQVSHVLTGAFQPDPSPDGRSVAVSTYSSRGFLIGQMTLDRASWTEKRGPSLPLSRELPPSPPHPRPSPGGRGESAAGSTELPTSSSYNALKTLYPHFWLPRISGDGSDGLVYGAFTAGADVLAYNSYLLSADYSSGRNRGYFNAVYNNDYFYPTFSLLGHIQPFLYENLDGRGDYWELNKAFTLQAMIPVNFLERRYRFLAGYQILDQQALSDLDRNGNFNGLPVFHGRRDNIFAGVNFNNSLKYPYSISYEEGRNISFMYRRFAKAIGSSQDLSEYSAEYHEFLRLPTKHLKHHVVYLRLSGGVADGDLRYGQQAFQIGGVPSDLNPYPLRGYPDRFSTGKYVATGTLEYRAPMFYPMRGPGTLPLFLEKVHQALFVDAGEVWDDRHTFSTNKVKVGAGFELRTDVTLGYWAKLTPALGFAHGFNQGGENQLYFTVYVDL